MSGTLRRSPVQPKSCYLRRSGTHFTPRAQQVLAVARNDALLARALYSVAVDMWLPTRSPGKEPRRVLAQLSQLAEIIKGQFALPESFGTDLLHVWYNVLAA